MHSSDWLPTFVVGIAGQEASVAVGPRPLDGHDLWSCWVSTNHASPRTEVIHQVTNQYTGPNCTPGGPCEIPGIGNTIRVSKFKMHSSSCKPGQDYLVPWPGPAQHPVPFGQYGGGIETGTYRMRVGGEQHDMAADPAMAGMIASLTARVEAAAATSPPWAWDQPLATRRRMLSTSIA